MSADEVPSMHKFLRERETVANMEHLECVCEIVNTQPQVKCNTEDVTNDEGREATTDHRKKNERWGSIEDK
jgi:hypothetical protein